MNEADPSHSSETLVVRRIIRATPTRLFEAWTRPKQLLQWWGPQDVECTHAAIDLKVGGRYQIDNRLPNGTIVSIIGEFETIVPPHELVFSWRLKPSSDPQAIANERVRVQFEDHGSNATLVTVTHQRIRTTALRDDHQRGWEGCLDGLSAYAGDDASRI